MSHIIGFVHLGYSLSGVLNILVIFLTSPWFMKLILLIRKKAKTQKRKPYKLYVTYSVCSFQAVIPAFTEGNLNIRGHILKVKGPIGEYHCSLNVMYLQFKHYDKISVKSIKKCICYQFWREKQFDHPERLGLIVLMRNENSDAFIRLCQ